MKKIETKIAKNGTKMYYVEGKRVSREIANQTAAENREENFTVEYRGYDSKLGRIADKVITDKKMRVEVRQEAGRHDMKFYIVINGENVNCFFGRKACDWLIRDAKKNANEFAGKILEAYINGEAGVKLVADEVIVINNEVDPTDYAVSQEAMDVAVDAETELANSEAQTSTPIINIADYNTMMTWAEKISNGQRDAVTPIVTYLSKFGYTADKQDVFNAIDTDDLNGFRRYISQFPFLVKDDAGYIQKLYVQADDEVVLAEIPTCEYPSTENNAPEFKYYIKSRRPIVGAVPKGYISATAGEMKAYSLRSDGSISPVPRKVVFGVVSYDHPLSDEQIINYDLHVDPRNPNPIIKGSDKEETQMTIEIPAEGKYEFAIGDDTVTFVNGKFHSVFSVKYHMAIVRDLVGCYSYCIFGDDDTKVHNVREHETSYDNFMETLHQRGNREKLLALRKDYIITDRLSENNSHMWYVNGKRSGQVKVYNLLQSYGLTIAEFLAEDEAYINERIAAGAARIAIEDQANFLKDKIARDAKPCDDNDEAFNLIPDVSELNDVEIDEASPANTLVADIEEDDVEELNPIIETKITKRSLDSVSLKLNGKRISLRNLEDALDAPRTKFAVINEYGKKYDCRRCSKDYYGFFGTSPEEYTIHFNTLGELVKHYAFDNIVRDTASETPVDSTLTADIAKYQAAFDTARQISIRAGSGVCKINGEEIWFNYGELRSISSDRYNSEITFNNGRKRFRYRGIVIKRADFLNRMSNEIVAAEQKEIFGKFYDDYQMPDTALDPNADYFQIRIFPKFANGTESSFHATANDFKRALELVELFKTLDLPFIGLIKRNTVCGEEYYRHNRDGSETINPPEPPKPTEHTADKEPYRPFTPKEEVDIINHNINWAKDTLATMTGDTYSDDWRDWTRSELETAIIDWQDEIADLQPQADKTAEPPKPVELVAPTVMSALETINEMFPLDGFVEDVSKPNFRSAVNGDWRLNIFIDKNGTPEAVSLAEDDQLFLTVKIKARSLRDSINRAIKTCVKNRIAYRKNHNAEMEKYEYELMHLLQAARRELEVA